MSGDEDEVWDDSPEARAADCLAEIALAAEELAAIEGLGLDGLRGFAEATKHVAEAYRKRVMPPEEQSDAVDA